MTDEELVLRARQGDTGAFDELVIRHQAAVYRAALAPLRVPEDAEDVAQEAFARAWSTLERFRAEASFKNVASDHSLESSDQSASHADELVEKNGSADPVTRKEVSLTVGDSGR